MVNVQTYFVERRTTRRDRLSTSETAGRDARPVSGDQGPGIRDQGKKITSTTDHRSPASRGLCAAAFVLAIGVCSNAQAKVYDFSGAHTGNTAFKGNTATIPTTDNTVPTTEFTSDEYTNVANSNEPGGDLRQTSDSLITTKALTRFVFTVSEDPATLLDLKVYWEGNTSNASGTVNLFLFNVSTGSYTTSLDNTNSTTDHILTSTTTTPTDFIDANGKVTVLVANSSNGKSINTDYVKITVSLPECIVDSDCQETPVDNVCTTDACSSGACTHTNNTAPCADDGNPCRNDVCSGGSCTHPVNHSHLPCGNAGTECKNQDTCGDFGICVNNGFKPNTVECRPSTDDCDAAEFCTGSGAACPNNVFEPNTVECRPSADDCDAAEFCTGSGAACPTDGFEDNGTSCDDGNACTQPDTCQSGTCSGSNPVVCTPLDVCHDAGTCNTGTGLCSNPRKAEGAPCGVAGSECEVQDTCTAFGFCTDNGFKSAATPCTGVSQGGDCDDDPADHCTGTSNVCVDVVITSCIDSDGCCPLGCDVSNDADCVGCTQNSDCNDNDVCNGAETCLAGVCRQGTALNCVDGDRCTTDSCDPDTGCRHVNHCDIKLQRQQRQR
jgi:hypothetical protein